MVVHRSEQTLFFVGGQSPVAAIPRARLADIKHRVEGKAQAPFLNSYREKVAEQGQFKPHGIVAGGEAALAQGAEPCVAIFGDDFSGEGGHGVLAQVLDQLLGLGGFGFARSGLLAGRHLGQVAL